MEKLIFKIFFVSSILWFISCNLSKPVLEKERKKLDTTRLNIRFKKYQPIKYDSLNSSKYLYFDFDFTNVSQKDSIIFYFDFRVLSNTKIDYEGTNLDKLTPSYDCLILENSNKEFRQFSTHYSKPALINTHKCFFECREKIILKKGIPFNIQNYGIDKGNLLFSDKILSFRFHYFYYEHPNKLSRVTSNWVKLKDILDGNVPN